MGSNWDDIVLQKKEQEHHMLGQVFIGNKLFLI